MIKKGIALIFIAFLLVACKKEKSNLEESTTLEVEEKNMGVVAKRTWTGCGPCGGWGFKYFDDLYLQYNNHAAFMAFKLGFDGVSSQGKIYFEKVNDLFGIGGGTPRFFYNFDTIHGINYSGSGSIDQHVNAEVIANSNYEFTFLEDKIRLKTTTKFFKSVDGDYVISPFLIVDNQVGNQAGHDDGFNTVHHKFVADLARPINTDIIEPWAYKVASGEVEKGYTINLEFEVDRKTEWAKNDISFALILYKREGNKYKFVNAFTK